MKEISIIGIDLAKNVCQLHGAAADGSVQFRKTLSRPQFHRFVAEHPQCLVVMEACGGAHHWARELLRVGHAVKLIAPHYVKPFIKRQKNDAADAEAIVEAALLYLAEKNGRFLPKEPQAKAEVTQWLMWQTGGLGPMAGQTHHFVKNNPGTAPYAEDRFNTEVVRLYRVLNQWLVGREFICDVYSIADMACWPWVSRHVWHQIDLADYPQVRAWYRRILSRDAVQRGYHVPVFANEIPAG
tara:strand:+ start:7487 stop:8209 length:723 start_codon:yes stop_codon:yes gene_type:complete